MRGSTGSGVTRGLQGTGSAPYSANNPTLLGVMHAGQTDQSRGEPLAFSSSNHLSSFAHAFNASAARYVSIAVAS
jgi:hypothetical protein